jgi:hypothetical protein
LDPRGKAVRSIAARLLSAWLACLVLAATLLFATAGPVLAGRCDNGIHQPSLDGLSATPMAGGPTTVIAFSVIYRDTRGCEPSTVAVVIPGVGTIPMTPTSGGFKSGMTYVAARTLPVGSWAFAATATSGFGPGVKTVALTSPAPIVITAPVPTPTPTPKPTPTPTPRPTATPKPTPKPTRTPKPTAKPGSTGPKATPKPAKSPRPAPGSAAPSASPGPTGSGTGAGLIGGPGGGDDGSGTATSPRGGSGGIVPILLAAVVATFGGGLLVVARRRRRGVPVEPAESAAPPPAEPLPDPTPIELGPLTPIDGALQGDLPARPALRFPRPAKPGTVRGTIAYRHVRVSAGPDDLRFAELARLERRDEVEVIGESAGYLQVRMPDGITGWVPRMVLVTAPAAGGAG